jgi:ABC-type antimicrobial peptide transport system permease subunit
MGKRFRIGGVEAPLLEIVGVARDGRYESLFEDPSPWIFLPASFPQLRDSGLTFRTILVRAASRRDMASIVDGLRAEVATLDARIPVADVAIAEHNKDFVLLFPRLAAALGTILGILALVLATLGIYSVMTYSVNQRTKEIGIRMALGARAADVLRLVLQQALALVVTGVVAGSITAFAVTRLLEGFLYGVTASDPSTFVATVIGLVSVALLATLAPARRATRVDPMVALRYE